MSRQPISSSARGEFMHCNAVARGESVSTFVYSSQTTFFSRPIVPRASACMHLVSAWINNRTASQRKAIVQPVYIPSPVMLLSDFHREAAQLFEVTIPRWARFPFSRFRNFEATVPTPPSLFVMVYRTKKEHIQRTNTNVKMGKKIWRIEGVGRGGFFFARFFRTIYYVWNKKEEEERRTAVIKTVAIHWMVFTIGETQEDERERKFLVAEEAPLVEPHAIGHGFFLSFFFSRDNVMSRVEIAVSRRRCLLIGFREENQPSLHG